MAKKNRPRKGYSKTAVSDQAATNDLLWGVNTVQEALLNNPRSVSEVLVQKGKGGPRLQEIIDAARQVQVRSGL